MKITLYFWWMSYDYVTNQYKKKLGEEYIGTFYSIFATLLWVQLLKIFLIEHMVIYTWAECLRSTKWWCYVIIGLWKCRNKRINNRSQTRAFVSFPWTCKIKVELIKTSKTLQKIEIPHFNIFVNPQHSWGHLLTNSPFPSIFSFRPNLGYWNLWEKMNIYE